MITPIPAQAARIATLTKRVTAPKARHGLPPEAPDDSSPPPSEGQKPSVPKHEGKAHPDGR